MLQATFGLGLAIGIASFFRGAVSASLYTLKFILPVVFIGLVLVRINWSIPRPVVAAWWLWVGTQITSLVVSQNPGSSIATIVSYILLFVYALGIARVYRERPQLLHLHVFLVTVAAVALSLVFADAGAWTNFGDRLRFQSGFNNPNFFGQVCAMGIYAGYRFLVSCNPSRLVKTTVVVLMAALAVPLYLSDSRGAMLFVLLAVTGAVLWRWRWAAVILTVAGLSLTLLFSDPLPRNFNVDDLSSYRLTRWADRLDEGFRRGSPWLGQGLAGEEAFDNSFVSMFSQTGLIGGTAGVVFTLILTFHILVLNTGAQSKAMWLAWLIYSTVESMYYSIGNPLSIYIWGIVLIALVRTRAAEDRLINA